MRKVEPLYLTDAECAAKIGFKPRTSTKAVFTVWERAGFPTIDPEVGKRYWPAVRAWLDYRNGLSDRTYANFGVDGEEKWD